MNVVELPSKVHSASFDLKLQSSTVFSQLNDCQPLLNHVSGFL